MARKKGPDLSAVARLYEESLERHGVAPKAVGWGDEETHDLRFQKLLTVVEGNDSAPISINDLGCGYGALYDYIKAGGLRLARYDGYDISEKMIETARKRIPGSDAEFFVGGRLAQMADYSFVSGNFNVRLDTDEDAWIEFVKSVLDDLNAHSRLGFAFNLLTTYVDYTEDHLFYGDPLLFFDHCKRTFSRKVSLLHDYPLFEWTITVRK